MKYIVKNYSDRILLARLCTKLSDRKLQLLREVPCIWQILLLSSVIDIVVSPLSFSIHSRDGSWYRIKVQIGDSSPSLSQK